MTYRRPVRSQLLIACAAAALLLAGCDQKDSSKNNANTATATAPADTQTLAAAAPPPAAALPLTKAAPVAAKPAPAAKALPPAPPAPMRAAPDESERYAYLDRAYSMGRAFGDAPPDYTYDYDDQQPMVWRSDDGYERVAEELPGGGVRYYYYQAGAGDPYLIQDPDYSYGYEGGELIVVYNADGAYLDEARARRQADMAGRYLARSRALYAASRRQQHEAVAQDYWNRQRARV
ncbi:MAG: hypothetical protein ABI963_07095, partial [Rhizomicrobium sp.]